MLQIPVIPVAFLNNQVEGVLFTCGHGDPGGAGDVCQGTVVEPNLHRAVLSNVAGAIVFGGEVERFSLVPGVDGAEPAAIHAGRHPYRHSAGNSGLLDLVLASLVGHQDLAAENHC